MSDRPDELLDLDDDTRRLLAERGRVTDDEVRRLADGILDLPARQTRPRWSVLAAVAGVVLLLGAGVLILPRLSLTGVAGPRPPDPAAFAGDPRLAAFCGPPEHAIAIFEMAHLRDYRSHFPAAYELKGLPPGDLDQPALVTIQAGPGSGGRLPAQPLPSATDSPNVHDLCIVLGRDQASWRPMGVSSVDTTGFTPPLATRSEPPFAGDPRLAACRDRVGDPVQMFEMTHAQWFPLYFPGWWKGAPELEVDDPALVVIGRAMPGMYGGPRASGVPEPVGTPTPAFLMCIAVGPPGNAQVHVYGPTWFDRIVPVLNAAEVARAAHMDPDVLADPSAFADPGRLAPCGGMGDHVEYIFEASPLRDLARYFPRWMAAPIPALDVDQVGTIVILRAPSGLPLPRLTVFQNDPGGNGRELCVIFSEPNPLGPAVLVPNVDITGFHVRLDEPAAGEPSGSPPSSSGPTVVTTPEPAPAWAGDASLSLDCVGSLSTIGPMGPMDIGRSVYSPDTAVSDFLEFVRNAALVFPAAGFDPADTTTGARLYTYVVGGHVKAVVVANAEGGLETGRWSVGSVASCDPSEFDTTRDFGQSITIWSDASGQAVSTSVLYERGDCYQATKLTVSGHLYVRDPTGSGYDPAQLEATYDGTAALPATAIRQPYVDGTRRLYVAKDGRAAFVVTGTSVERWPHVKGDEYQRIDCN